MNNSNKRNAVHQLEVITHSTTKRHACSKGEVLVCNEKSNYWRGGCQVTWRSVRGRMSGDMEECEGEDVR